MIYMHLQCFCIQVKLCARSQGMPKSWDDKEQGYVVKKYDYMTRP